MAIEADHYIICMCPPAPTERRRRWLIPQILAENGYDMGEATIDFRVDDLAQQDSFLYFVLRSYEDSTGKKADMNRSRLHNFSGKNAVRGKMIAVFVLRAPTPEPTSHLRSHASLPSQPLPVKHEADDARCRSRAAFSEECPTCRGSRRILRSVSRSWWEVLLQRPAEISELCSACGGIGVVKGVAREEEPHRGALSTEPQRYASGSWQERNLRSTTARDRGSKPPPDGEW